MSLTRLKWLAIVLPLAFLLGLDFVRRSVFSDQLYDFPGAVVLYTLLAAVITGFSFIVFAAIDRLQARVVRQNRQLMALNQIAGASATNLKLPELLNVALDTVLSVMGVESGAICLLDAETEELVASCYRGISEELAERIRRQKLGDDPVGGQVVRTGQPVIIEKLMEQPGVAEVARREGFKRAISVPLKSEGQVAGVLAIATRREGVFTADEVELLTNIGGQLGLAVRNSVLFVKAEQRNQELQALLAVVKAATASLDLSETLDRALDVVLDVTSAETAEVWLVDEKGDLTLEKQRGIALEAFRETTRLRSGEGLPGLALKTGSPVVVNDLGSDARFVRRAVVELGFECFLALPLRQPDETVGVLAIASRDRTALSSTSERRLLEGIGEQLATSIENRRLHRRVLDVAVLEERERIARELHDGLAQVLGYINTQTLAIRRLLAMGRLPEAEEQLSAMEDAAREVYADIREAILSLRTLSIQDAGLVNSLRSYAARFSEMAGVAVQVDSSGETASAKLSRSAEIQLLRIIQEALTNVRKHARASSVTVRFEAKEDLLLVNITDDGEGFDRDGLSRRGWPRFGLQTMRERATAIGGEFALASQPGLGTTVTVSVPLTRTAEETHESPARR